MRCAQVRRALSAYLDGEVAEARRLAIASHLEGCAACRAEREALAAAWDALLLSPEARAAAGFEDRLRQRIAAHDAAAPTLGRTRLERLREAFRIPARRLAFAGALAGIAAGWLLGHASPPASPTSSAAGRVALRQEASRAFALDMLTEVPPDSAGAPYVTLTGCGSNVQ